MKNKILMKKNNKFINNIFKIVLNILLIWNGNGPKVNLMKDLED